MDALLTTLKNWKLFSVLLLSSLNCISQTDNYYNKLKNTKSLNDIENSKSYIQLNGSTSYVESTNTINGIQEVTMMGWFVIDPNTTKKSFLFGQDKCKVILSNNNKIVISINDKQLTYNKSLLKDKWIHFTVTYGNSAIKLYINGENVATQNCNTTIINDTSNFIIGKNPISNKQYFKGKIDEVRVFNKVLTVSQIQKMVYQEIEKNGDLIKGTVIPKNIPDLAYSSLIRYYKFDEIKDNTIVNEIETDKTLDATMFNIEKVEFQTAPMPFVTVRNGNFLTSIENNSNFLRAEDIYQYDWTIIEVNHDIIENTNTTFLGMLVESSATIKLNNNNKLQNNWYLKLDGKIDLEGQSQLIQKIESDLDPSSIGFIERDQQGTSNMFNFNYWSSPVSSINATTINHGFTVPSILKDGTNPENPQTIQWTPIVTPSTTTTPITLSSYWLFKFQNLTPIYANWSTSGLNGLLLSGQGFTMKGSGTSTPFQNYVFKGKPNNGTITIDIAANNMNLTGNPYPSAIDANEFIKANSESTTGTLYFWEHFETNNTHNLNGYQGGYAARNLVGATNPISASGTSGIGTSSRKPGRFIPVGQGFIVYGSPTGGNIVYNNNQRIFVKETNAQSNSMFRPTENTTIVSQINQEDFTESDEFMRIRIGFNSYNNYHRQVLLGFMNEYATSAVEVGYDAPHLDYQQNDMYFINGNYNLTIQGEGYFNENKIYPLGVKTFQEGLVQFTLDGVENTPNSVGIYIYDNETNLYHDIRNEVFEINLTQGEFTERFSLRFTNQILSNPKFDLAQDIKVCYASQNNMLTIINETPNLLVQNVLLYTILGQNVFTWNVENKTQNNIQLPVGNVTAGTYIVQILTNSGTISKKIIIK